MSYILLWSRQPGVLQPVFFDCITVKDFNVKYQSRLSFFRLRSITKILLVQGGVLHIELYIGILLVQNKVGCSGVLQKFLQKKKFSREKLHRYTPIIICYTPDKQYKQPYNK